MFLKPHLEGRAEANGGLVELVEGAPPGDHLKAELIHPEQLRVAPGRRQIALPPPRPNVTKNE